MATGTLYIWVDGMALSVLVAPSFARAAKKLHARDKAVLGAAAKPVASDPALGEEKHGDLGGVFVHKFQLNKRAPKEVVLLAVGPHENFYTQLKR